MLDIGVRTYRCWFDVSIESDAGTVIEVATGGDAILWL